MPLTKLQFRPGINREVTSYSNEGGWFDGDKIRFRFGFAEKIGGWVRFIAYSFLGSARSIHGWVALDNSRYIGLGTTNKFYTSKNASLMTDITPIRATTSAGDVTFVASDGSSTLTVTDADHGCTDGSFVTFSGAVSLGGNITADVLNQEYQVTVADNNSYTILAREAGTTIASITEDGALNPTLVVANSSDTGNGGSSVVGEYQVNAGLDVATIGTAWGIGFWGRGTWGSDAVTFDSGANGLRLWSQDNFGEDLLFNERDGEIYYWDTSAGGRAVALQDLAGANKVPQVAKQVLVSDQSRHIIAFGTDPESSPGVQDPLILRFNEDGSTIFPYTGSMFRAKHSRTSFPAEIPEEILNADGVYVVEVSEMPDFDPLTHQVDWELKQGSGSKWVKQWNVTPLPEEEAARRVKALRSRTLAETDWCALSDVDMSAEMRSYRQALRDITEQEGFPHSITWPEKPE